jgi:5-methylcytosine-specific restriction endonuclease McrA
MTKQCCTVEGCGEPARTKSLCEMHYWRWRSTGQFGSAKPQYVLGIEICTVEGCGKASHAKGLCEMHYWRWRITGEVGCAGPRPGEVVGIAGPQQRHDAVRRHRMRVEMTAGDRKRSAQARREMRENHEPCVYCGRPLTDSTRHVDHVIPLARGGTDHWWNLQSTCATCNTRKGTKTHEEFEALLLERLEGSRG